MEGQGVKIGSTAIIWSLATGMMAISIPIIKMTGTGIVLPLAVIIGVSLSTIAIWLSTWMA